MSRGPSFETTKLMIIELTVNYFQNQPLGCEVIKYAVYLSEPCNSFVYLGH